MLLPRLILVAFLVSGSTLLVGLVNSHEVSGDWKCEPDSEARVPAEFRPGVVTLDGHADDWKDVDGFEFSLLPALDPDAEHEYKGGKMIVKALHDGKDMFFLLQVDGDYIYSKGRLSEHGDIQYHSLSGKHTILIRQPKETSKHAFCGPHWINYPIPPPSSFKQTYQPTVIYYCCGGLS